MKITTGLLLKFQTKTFTAIREILEKHSHLITQKSNWHEEGLMVMAIILSRPDTHDEGQLNFYNGLVEEMVVELRATGASVEFRSITISEEEEKTAPPAA